MGKPFCALSILVVATLLWANVACAADAMPMTREPMEPTARLTTSHEAVAPAPTLDRPATRLSWYGYQTLLVDGLALAVGLGFEEPPLGVALYLLGAPAVHAAHLNPMAFASLATRAVGGLLAATSGLYCALGAQSDTDASGLCAAAIVFAVAPIVLDAAVYSFKRVPIEPDPRHHDEIGREWSLSVRPYYLATTKTSGAMMFGEF